MGRSLVGRATFSAAVVALLSAQVIAGCGSSGNSSPGSGGSGADSGTPNEGGSTNVEGGSDGTGAGETGNGGAGGTVTAGGAFATGGMVATSGGFGSGGKSTASGGRGGAGGDFTTGGVVVAGSGGSSPSTGGTPATGGGPGCVAGVPCTCKKLVGVTECDAGEATCVCPPAAECEAKAEAPCFEPCGGEPFGAWVLEEGCFSATASSTGTPDCEKLVQGKSNESDLRMRLLDGGEMQFFGREHWTISARVGLECLAIKNVRSCELASYWPDALLFSQASVASCVANACGVCDCEADTGRDVPSFSFDRWSREDTTLQLGFVSVPYCVTGDELWIGGSDNAGNGRVSYKFKKQSCAGTPKPCASRTEAECSLGGHCSIGACKATSGTSPRCAAAYGSTECSVLQGCTWDPKGCAGAVADACEFETCGSEPGCTFGPPKERCGGFASPCEERDLSACAGDGCSVHVCQTLFSESVDCNLLSNATECGKAPGCVFAAGACTGQALCTAQTDPKICEKLECSPGDYCSGTPSECSTLSVAKCHDVPGCRLEW